MRAEGKMNPVRDDILYQEFREFRVNLAAFIKSLDLLAQLLTELLVLLRGSATQACRCRAAPSPPASPPPLDEGELYPLEQVARTLRRSEQVTRGWCREIEDEEDRAEQRARQQQLYEMERQGVPVERRLYLLKIPARTVRHVGGNDSGPWEITPAGLRKLQAMNNVRPRRPSDNGDADGEGTS